MKTWIIAILILVLGGPGLYWWSRQAEQSAASGRAGWSPPPAIVEVARVEIGSVVRNVRAIGTLRAYESVTIRPEISGRITGIHFDEGQQVKRGTVLIELDDSVYAAEVMEKTAGRRLAELAFDRANKLVERRVASVEDRDIAFAQLQADEAALQLAQARLAKTLLRAPFDGIIGLRHVSIGDYVDSGDDLVGLVELDPIKVDFRIGEIHLSDIAPGQNISIRVNAFPNEEFSGRVYAIEPQVDINGRAIIIRAELPNTDRRLRPGLFARIDLIVSEAAEALLVSEDAIVPRGDQHFVYRLIESKAILTEVALGKRKDTWVEITDGLTADDIVITAGQLKLRDGATVRTTGEVTAGTPQPSGPA
ncbi:MAG: efflux RND transporter periplasmic adaptor subunit [Gammaproteobacteria bacterium]|nr:MAG: efflux RND transporter periplasmic adaptor subunit [Gammaproteobacteria bacterium]